MTTPHVLKCWPEYYEAVIDGRKPFELRYADRPFRVGDVLLLREFDPERAKYTGREARVEVTYLLSAADHSGLCDGYVIMGLKV